VQEIAGVAGYFQVNTGKASPAKPVFTDFVLQTPDFIPANAGHFSAHKN
jgi:hypothetical protein